MKGEQSSRQSRVGARRSLFHSYARASDVASEKPLGAMQLGGNAFEEVNLCHLRTVRPDRLRLHSLTRSLTSI